ncbi:MarR family winged helix-turn-helix transcriptional regulator [Arthrobacter mobilis]|uniref:MarR family winged helix-turn-helix transcriptional regulator n=1 Tax=Arthrobacter mobilis TaxID=2724944 RepID=UPI0028AAECAE|nr:MarR family transcriptional regulator [Arthrobacter mobilis]
MADENLLDSFWAVARQLRRRSREALAPWDVSPSQSRALGVLRRHGPLRLGELSERLHIVPRSATEVVDGLQERGWCVREPDPADRRATVVSLTEAGRALADAIRAAQQEQARNYFGVLGTDERAELAALLDRLVGNP